MTTLVTFGQFLYDSNSMLLLRFVISTIMLLTNFTYPSNVSNVTMVKNLTTLPCAHSSLPREFFFVSLALIPRHKMAKQSELFDQLTISCTLFSFKPI
jgi:hypothetical protein